MARPTTAIITVLILAVLFLVFDLHNKTKQNLNYQAKFSKSSGFEEPQAFPDTVNSTTTYQ